MAELTHIQRDGDENEATKINLKDTSATSVHLDLDESKAHLISANGGAGKNDELKTAIIDPASASSDGEISFNGLGKEEVMRYANDPFWVRLRWILFILFWIGWLAMLVTAVVIIVLAPRCPPRPDLKWYQTETVYQVFPKSFKDSDNDGVGDFKGLTDKLGYVTDKLGIKAVWISSMYLADKQSTLGVLDHKDIDESFKVSVEGFKAWLRKLRKEGVKVILDLIPNQTSKNHTWFLNSVQDKERYRDYYIWSKGGPAGGPPPNDWKTVDGKPAWTYNAERGMWYFHQFSEEYPDLNLANENVTEEIKDIMKFWFDAGVSGFHIEGLEYLVENPDLTAVDDDGRNQTRNYVGTYGFLEKLREVANSFSDKPGRERLLFGTAEHASENQTLEYWGAGDKKRLHIVTSLLDLTHSCDVECIRAEIDQQITDGTDQWHGIQLGDQNHPRIASKLSDGTSSKDYKFKLVIAYTLQLLLPGTPFNYYGDEFGQRNGNTSTGNPEDNYRTPMQWNSQKKAGFSGKNVTTWLPVGPDYETDNLQANLAHLAGFTPFEAFKALLELRSNSSFQWGKTTFCTPKKDVLMFTRKAFRFPYFLVIINTGSNEVQVSPEDLACLSVRDEGKIKFHSQEKEVGTTLSFKDQGIHLKAMDVVVLEFTSEE